MTYYNVVTRDRRRLVIAHFSSIEAAGAKIVRESAFHSWTVLAQDGGKAAPMRELRSTEHRTLARVLYPTLHDERG